MNLHQNFKMVKSVAWKTMDVLLKSPEKKTKYIYKGRSHNRSSSIIFWKKVSRDWQK